jgi:serine/threonine protein kinase
MGVVFHAEDTQLERPVALKVMRPAVASVPANRARFLHEARATALIEHDHIVTIYQVGEENGVPFLAMKLLRGQSLEDRLREEGGWLQLSEVLRIGREVAEGLAAAHAKNLIHRDIKPANIWLEEDRGRVKIVDFGLARAASSEIHLTQDGLVVGTPAYMAPEQANGDTLDFRCDLFSLGCVLYRLSTGQLPFPGKDSMAVMMAIAIRDVEPPRAIDPGVPKALSELILQLLAKVPEDRPRSARAVADALAKIERDQSVADAVACPTTRRAREKGSAASEEEFLEVAVVAEANEEPETIDQVEVVQEETREESSRRRRRMDGGPSGLRKKSRLDQPEEEEGSERNVLILGLVAVCVIVILLVILSIRRVIFHADDPSSRGPAIGPRFAVVTPTASHREHFSVAFRPPLCSS